MKKTHAIIAMALFLSGIFFTGSMSRAEDIKSRMLNRKPVIDALKDQGIIGENNKGFLEFIGNRKEKEQVVHAENMDRQTVYNEIAGQQNTSPELVGKRRAIQLEEKSETGHWVQSQEGKWYQK